MWSSGAARNRRRRALAEMVATAVRTGEFTEPWRATPEVLDCYGDEAAVLRELARDWATALAGAVYVAIEAGEGDVRADVQRALAAVSSRHRGTRQILEAHGAHPAIAAAMRKEAALLAFVLDVSAREAAA